MEDKFIVLKHSFIRDPLLTMQEKIIFLEILNLSSLEKGCIASNSHFEKCFGISKKSVSNTISSLVDKGYIFSELSNRNHTRILSIKDGGVSIKDGESKENNTINKQVNKDMCDKSQSLVSLWNEMAKITGLQTVQKLTDKRKKKISLRFKDTSDFERVFKAMISKIIDSSFLRGSNNRKWKVDFDFVIDSEDNYVKICEGKYDDPKGDY